MDRSIGIFFVIGALLGAVAAFVPSAVLPWVVGGAGIGTGIVAWRKGTPNVPLMSILLVVSLSAIIQQPFNPSWLTQGVFFFRVYVAHVGLALGLLAILAARPNDEP
jgi:hypothetical protein